MLIDADCEMDLFFVYFGSIRSLSYECGFCDFGKYFMFSRRSVYTLARPLVSTAKFPKQN